MNLTEWITKEDLSIKEFTKEFCNVVKENFGEHNYKCVLDSVHKHLASGVEASNRQTLSIQSVSYSADEVVNELEQSDTLDDALMFFRQQSESINQQGE